MVLARQLYTLQELDAQVQQAQQALASLEVRLSDDGVVRQAREEVARARGQAEALRVQQRALELDIEECAEKIAASERRMYGGRVTNPKELVGIQEEVKLLKRRKAGLEDQVLGVMEQVEASQAALGQAAEQARAVEQKWQAEHQQFLQEKAQVASQLAETQQEYARLEQTITLKELELYRSLRSTRGGIAVARVERGICRACGIALPQHVVQRARSGQELVRCTSCNRILFAE
ncbi:MAG: hypothetical protein HY683_07445 [Chloroflexi bacterium]|nr:hypothetical protein [Chloroflexota bacterium]